MAAVRCPYCEKDDDRVLDSRGTDGGRSIRRRRVCLKCDKRFTTYERIERTSRLMVVKRDGARTPFDPEKVLAGIQAACGKRPISEEQKVAIVSELEEELRSQFEREVPSVEIGKRVAVALRGVDKIAYVRYASEYFEFQDLEDLAGEVANLQNMPPEIAEQTDLFAS